MAVISSATLHIQDHLTQAIILIEQERIKSVEAEISHTDEGK